MATPSWSSKDNRTVGGSASVNGTTASYTFVPDGNGFTLTPDHAKQYLLPAVRVMPTDGTTGVELVLLHPARMPQRHSCRHHAGRPRGHCRTGTRSNAVYTQEVNLYSDPRV